MVFKVNTANIQYFWFIWFIQYLNGSVKSLEYFLYCSEISINVIVKHVHHAGIIWPFSLPGTDLLSFFSA